MNKDRRKVKGVDSARGSVPFQAKCQYFADSKDTTFAPSRLNDLS